LFLIIQDTLSGGIWALIWEISFDIESRERWTGSTWESRSKTTYVRTCHLDKTIQGDGSATPSVTEYCYDLNDNLEKVWDANHPKATNPNPTQLYAYDALNRLTTLTVGPTTANAAATNYTYDVQDHLASVTDAEGNATAYTYSDRDLLTQEVSPVSGTTVHTYDEHGELLTTTDARAIVTTRTVDNLDRVKTIGYSDGTPGTSYAYDVGTFGKGRLSSITRSGQAVAYGYDRFGRLIQDGALGYGYDANGNRTRLTYPNNVAAFYTNDFADREATLTYEQSGSAQPPAIVSSAAYEPFGPLTSLSLGNGLTETRLFDARYFPDRIQVPGRLDWDYTVDAVGNPLQIADLLVPAQSRTYAYQDYQYFLTQGNGPWGTRSWTYDRIGNRLTETRGGVTDTYGYTGGNPKLQTIALGGGAGTKYYAYDGAGNQVQDSRPNSELQLGYDAAGRLTRLEEATTETESFLLYDGRGFLSEARQDLDLCSPIVTQATYTSEGVLVHRAHRNALAPAASPLDEDYVFYLAGRPVAILEGIVPATLTRKYLTADHLGTPVLTTSGAAVTLWAGGFEPFGKDWNGAQGVGVFLRFPGQWEDSTWQSLDLTTELYYNVHRYYDMGAGRYTRPDPVWSGFSALSFDVNQYVYALQRPIGLQAKMGRYAQGDRYLPLSWRDPNLYSYSRSRPIFLTDPKGLFIVDPSCDCTPQWKPAENIPKAIGLAGNFPGNPKCQAILQKYGVWPCVPNRFGPNEIGKGPLIKCQKNRPGSSACGETTPPVTGVPLSIHLFPGASSCPRNNSPSGISVTLFHETVHSCNLGLRESAASEITEVCTGWY
jgi:RHS repeat-associated protein